jgi:hypothetical protein
LTGAILSEMRKVILFSFILVLLLKPGSVWANSAPIMQPEPNGSIIPMEDIAVQVKEEKLQFVLHDEGRPADVFVQYTFLNPTTETIETYLAFPYTPPYHSPPPRIFINDKEQSQAQVQVELQEENFTGFMSRFQADTFIHIDPITGEMEDDWQGYDMIEESYVATFKVSFPANQETTLRIHYQQEYGMDTSSYIQPVHLYQYLLQPASAWKEFHHLQIIIAVPKNHYFSSNLPLQSSGERGGWLPGAKEVEGNPGAWNFYQGEFQSLPKENLAFSTMTKDDLLFGMVSKQEYDVLVFLILWCVSTLAAIGAVYLITRVRKWWLYWLLGPVLSFIAVNIITILFYALFISLVPVAQNGDLVGGYNFIITFFLLDIYIILIYFVILMFVFIKRKWQKHRHRKKHGIANERKR